MTVSAAEIYINSTQAARLKGFDIIKNFALLPAYLYGEMRKQMENQYVRGGDPLIWQVIGGVTGGNGNYAGGEPLTIGSSIRAPQGTAQWRMKRHAEPIVDSTVDLNEGDEARHLQKVTDQIFASLDTSHLNDWEASLWNPPDSSMTSLTNRKADPMSIPLWVPTSNSATGAGYTGLPAGWSGNSIAGIDRVVNPGTVPVCMTYTANDPSNPETGISSALGAIFTRTLFEAASENMGRTGMKESILTRFKICTGQYGKDKFERSQAKRRDNNGMDSDASAAMFRGLKVSGYKAIDQSNLDHSTTTPFTQPFPANRPPFWCLDLNEIGYVHHQKHDWREQTADGGAQYPDTRVVLRVSWGQLIASLTNRLGVACGV